MQAATWGGLPRAPLCPGRSLAPPPSCASPSADTCGLPPTCPPASFLSSKVPGLLPSPRPPLWPNFNSKAPRGTLWASLSSAGHLSLEVLLPPWLGLAVAHLPLRRTAGRRVQPAWLGAPSFGPGPNAGVAAGPCEHGHRSEC